MMNLYSFLDFENICHQVNVLEFGVLRTRILKYQFSISRAMDKSFNSETVGVFVYLPLSAEKPWSPTLVAPPVWAFASCWK